MMALGKREKTLLTVTAAVLGVLALDQYVLTPMFDDEDHIQLERQSVLSDIQRAQQTMADRKKLVPQWKQMLNTGLKTDPSEAESQLLHAMRDWARDSDLNLTSVKPDRPDSKAVMRELQVQALATGSLESVAKFLFKAQAAEFPLKVTDLQMGVRNENANDLALQFKAITLYYVPSAKSAAAEKSSSGNSGEAQ